MAITDKTKGITIVELIIVIAIISIGLIYLLGSFAFYLGVLSTEKNLNYANFLAQQNLEGLRSVRDRTNWENDGLGTVLNGFPYHLEASSSQWVLSSGEISTGGFTQKIIFDDVYRDINDNIVEAGGTLDSESKKITVIILWNHKGKEQNIELITFLTNWGT